MSEAMLDLFKGFWRIEKMEVWDREFVNMLGQANIVFDDDELGSFEFGAVVGFIDCRFSKRNGKPFVEFSWQGTHDGEVDCGRGWGSIAKDGSLRGRIFLHRSDDSGFTAYRS